MNLKPAHRKAIAAAATALLVVAALGWWQQYRDGPHYLQATADAFAAGFPAPPPAGSPPERAELQELLDMQSARTVDDVEAAHADRKTEVSRFYDALGLDPRQPPSLPELEAFAERVGDDIGIRVRDMKKRFLRRRPYVIEPRIDPCIADVRGDRSYPSGHAAWGYGMAYLLARMVPERATELMRRADAYARQRMVCGVHFRSDLEAGRLLAERTLSELLEDPRFRAEANAAGEELRGALGLGPMPRP